MLTGKISLFYRIIALKCGSLWCTATEEEAFPPTLHFIATATARRKRKCGRVIAQSLIISRAITLCGKRLSPSVWHKGM